MPIYMKVSGVEGPLKGKYKGWIELQSCQLGLPRQVNPATGEGTNREATTQSFSEIVVTKSQDSTSTDLFRLSLWGEGRKVQIDFVAKDSKNEVPYMSLELENTLISSYSVSGRGGDLHSVPVESLSLNFTKITYSNQAIESSKDPKDLKGRAAWDLATGRGS